MPNTVFVFDIDNTVANTHERAHLLKEYCVICGGSKHYYKEIQFGKPSVKVCTACTGEQFFVPPKSWRQFLNKDLVKNDPIYPQARSFINNAKNKGIDVNYITGRHEALRDVTEDWLKRNYIFGNNSKLIMRKFSPFEDDKNISDKRPAEIYKKEAFAKLKEIKDYRNEFFLFFDDDNKVLDMYKQFGVTCKAPDCWTFLQ